MATKGSTAEDRPRPAGAAAGLIAPSAPPQGHGASQAIQGYRPPFVLLARLDRLEPSGGLILPDLARVEAVPGRFGNASSDTIDPAGAVANLERLKYRRIPDDLDFVCWGAPRAGAASGSTYRDYYTSDRIGGVWAEAWIRPKIVGGVTRWQLDMDGKRAFQAAVLKWMLHGAELDRDLAEAACAPAIEVARAYLNAASNPVTRARLADLVSQLPREFTPPDLAEFAPLARGLES